MSDISSGQPAEASVQPAAPNTVPESNTVLAAPENVQDTAPENNANGHNNPASTLSEEASKYLKSQNLDLSFFGIDQNNADAVSNFIEFHKSMRQAKSEQTKQTNVTPATPDNVLGTQTQTQPAQSQTQPAQIASPSQLDIVNMKMYLDSVYPEIKDQVGTKEFYDGMRGMGFNPLTSNGQFNVSAISQYADILNTKAENTRLKAELNKPNPSMVPDTNNSVNVTLDSLQVNGADMTGNQAANIIMSYNNAIKTGKTVSAEDKALYDKAVEVYTAS